MKSRKLYWLITGGAIGFLIAVFINIILTYIWVILLIFVIGMLVGGYLRKRR